MTGCSKVAALVLGVASASAMGSLGGCATEASVTATVQVIAAPLLGASVAAINGTYGSGCTERAGPWSVRVGGIDPLAHAPLSVVANNSACTLTITSVDAGQTYTGAPLFAMTTAFQATASAYALAPEGPVAFYGNAKLDAPDFASDFAIQLLVSSDPAASGAELTSTLRPAITVVSTDPASGASAVCPSALITATFLVPEGLRLDPATLDATTFIVTGPGPAFTPVTASSITLDAATGHVATFTPAAALPAEVTYTATLRGGADGIRDVATPGHAMRDDFQWSFSVVPATGQCLAPIALGSFARFAIVGGPAAITNAGTLTVIHGDLASTAAASTVTGFHDAGEGCVYTETPLNIGFVDGAIVTDGPPPTGACPSEGTGETLAIAIQAHDDAAAAFASMVAAPAGPDPSVSGNLGGLTLTPGVYTSSVAAFAIQGADLTLDAEGNANAVWIFQMSSTLTVGGPGAASPASVVLVNGAQAANVFWQVGSAATINAAGGGTMVGTIVTQSGATFSTAGNVTLATLEGRVASLAPAITMVNTAITVPADPTP